LPVGAGAHRRQMGRERKSRNRDMRLLVIAFTQRCSQTIIRKQDILSAPLLSIPQVKQERLDFGQGATVQSKRRHGMIEVQQAKRALIGRARGGLCSLVEAT